MIETDHLMRALRIQEKSEKLIKSTDPEIVSTLVAFADGVNQYIENYPLPPEFKVLGYKPEPWEPVHSINLIGYMSWDLTSGWGTEILLNKLKKEISEEQLLELIPDLKNHKTAIFPEMKLPEVIIEESLLSASQKLEDLGIEIFHGSNN
ncbi:MAG: penicillin acylase family protein [Mariniphaga sp.]|nr:penicillin acylase family protein [Mariniphaga sp.]